jgi:hypothetical protein
VKHHAAKATLPVRAAVQGAFDMSHQPQVLAAVVHFVEVDVVN